MRSGTAEPRRRGPVGISARRWPATTDDPAVAVADLLAGIVMNVAGPLFWAALAVGCITDVVRTGLFG
jgi:hypothetical protein